MGAYSRSCGGCGKVSAVPFRSEPDTELHVLGGSAGGNVPDDGLAWHGPAYGAANAGCAESAGVEAGVAFERGCDLFAIHAFSADRRGALRFLWTASGGVRFGGPNLPNVYCARDADRDCRAVGGCHSRRGDVEFERGVEFPFVDDCGGFLYALEAGGRRQGADDDLALEHGSVGAGAVWRGCI